MGYDYNAHFRGELSGTRWHGDREFGGMGAEATAASSVASAPVPAKLSGTTKLKNTVTKTLSTANTHAKSAGRTAVGLVKTHKKWVAVSLVGGVFGLGWWMNRK